MKRRFKTLLFALVAMAMPLVANAQTKVEIGGIWYNLTAETLEAEVTKSDSTEYSGSITLTATVTYDGVAYSVTSIGNWAFNGCTSLTAITIPEGVTSIGNFAFHNCSSLTAITIPESVTSIGNKAFDICRSLTSIVVASGNKVYDSRGDCNAIIETNSNTLIKGCATTIIPEDVTSIGDGAFRACSSLTTITIPKGVTSIGDEAFSNCGSLTAITIPEGVTSIGNYAFYACTDLTDITIPEGVTSIRDHAFKSCSSLTAITIPKGVTSIEGWAFDACINLTDITIPEGVTSIGNYAFLVCSSLTAITIPESVTSIGKGAFQSCSSLTDVYCHAATVPSTETNAFSNSNIENATLHVPASAVNSYKNTAPWSSFGKVETLEITVDDITLSQSAAELIEGESLQLTATVSPDDATDKTVTWSSSDERIASVDANGVVTAVAAGTATITVTANDGSGVSAQCEVTVNELLGKCATPTISYTDGKVVLTCATEGAKVITDVVAEDAHTYEDLEFTLSATYTLSAYATKEYYENSDTVTLTLCWVPCTEEHEKGDVDGILTIPAKPVLIQCQGGVITLSGLDDGTKVAVVTTGGTTVATATATNGTATLATNLTAGTIAIVKTGDYSIKVAIK